MTEDDKNQKFLEQVYKKEEWAYKSCSKMLEQKVKYATILLSISGVEKLYNLHEKNNDAVSIFILLVPFVVYCFDILILAENKNVRVVGDFLHESGIVCAETWNEHWKSVKMRNLFLWGSHIISWLAFVISCAFYIALYPSILCDNNTNVFVWLLLNISFLISLIYFNKKVIKNEYST